MKRWYHVTDEWKGDTIKILPRKGRRDSNSDIDQREAICVAPSFHQCMYAVGDWLCLRKLRLYEAIEYTDEPLPADYVFDYSYTDEHRFYVPVLFKLVKEYDIEIFEDKIPVAAYYANKYEQDLDFHEFKCRFNSVMNSLQ